MQSINKLPGLQPAEAELRAEGGEVAVEVEDVERFSSKKSTIRGRPPPPPGPELPSPPSVPRGPALVPLPDPGDFRFLDDYNKKS